MPARLPPMKNVFSSHVDRVGYDPDTQQLHVHFSNGSEGFYDGVPERIARSVIHAPSIGIEMHRILRYRSEYPFSYLKKGG